MKIYLPFYGYYSVANRSFVVLTSCHFRYIEWMDTKRNVRSAIRQTIAPGSVSVLPGIPQVVIVCAGWLSQ
jgi:hypothetical protein